ncbi:hypothetical protein WA026_016966 [Henosepilachna vigintioctopunctata]|uniref:Band 3 cytoplasmic domain-containing protein n=1 Tax=Henosepilachna vigintioctopunctata TaxID=420089 RepID=A0AAW1U974_9CUCU
MPTEKLTPVQRRTLVHRAREKLLNWIRHLGHQNDGGSNDGEVQLDEECAKVFAMDGSGLSAGFDINKFHDPPPTSDLPRKYSEKDFIQHRKKSYPHTLVPFKIASKSMRRRQSQPPPSTAIASTNDSPNHQEAQDSAPITTTDLSLSPREEDSTTVLLSSITLPEESDTAANSSESEGVFSEPCNYNVRSNDSFEKKVQFLGDEKTGNGSVKNKSDIDKKRRKHFLHNNLNLRKYSLPTDVSEPIPTAKKRHRHHHHHHHHHHDKGDTNEKRRVSTQPEDLPLKDADRDQLDSHRSDDQKGLRRTKISRPSNASMVHIGRKEGGELHPAFNKMYDHSPHAIFVELDELHTSVEENEWKERARWIKYEEDVEEGVDRWGKPHVASLSFHSLLNLRKCLEDGLVLLDMEERDLPAIAYRVTEDLYKEDLIREEDKGKIMRTLLLRHRHVNEHHDRGFRFTKKHSYASLQNLHDLDRRKTSIPFEVSGNIKNGHLDAECKLLGDNNHIAVDIRGEETYSASSEDVRKGRNDTILKKIPAGAQASSVLVGEVDFLEQPAISFIRLAEGVVIPSLIEVNIPCRFIFILLGPKRANIDYHEVGRSISTLMTNQQFLEIAYGAYDRKALLSAINEFLDDSIVLPPGDWERQALLPIEELKAKSEKIRKRKENALKKAAEAQGITKPLLDTVSDEDKNLRTTL